MSERPETRRRLVLLLSGPNLNLLGEREPDVYGDATLDEHVEAARRAAGELGLELQHLQSNHEGEIHDALAAFSGPVVEVHLSNPQRREPWRHTSVVSPVATGTITGLGGLGYVLAVKAVARLLDA